MNPLQGMRIEYHILQSFPVTCLNRDDVGAPKTAIVGGTQRARVSSQCWKRQVRLALHDFGIKLGVRTKDVEQLLEEACLEAGASAEQALECARAMAGVMCDDTLLFFSHTEASALGRAAAEKGFKVEDIVVLKNKKNAKSGNETGKNPKGSFTPELKKVLKNALNPAADGLDIALFGRMVAQDPEMNMRAAASFAHAISTHASGNEVDFFTALDDLGTEPGSAHMGALEYNSATYYRYISLDLGQLYDNLRGQGLEKAVDAFTKALYLAVPVARQTTQTGFCPWNYARVLVRKGQGMQICFDKPVRADNGYLAPSIKAMDEALDKQEKLAGSLYGGIASHTLGIDSDYNIDRLAADLAAVVNRAEAGA